MASPASRGRPRRWLPALVAVLLVAGAGVAIRAAGVDHGSAAVVRSSPFVTACGTRLCADGEPFRMRSASVLAIAERRDETIRLAKDAGLNTIRLVDFLDDTGPLSGATDEARWRRVDESIAAARQAGLRVELDLSTYRNLLLHRGRNPYATDWRPFLRFVATRTNTVTRVRYADDPTIALVAFAGELEPPRYRRVPRSQRATARQIQAFFVRTFAAWRRLDRNHLTTTGGLLFLGDPYAGIDWRRLVRTPGNDVCTIHVYTRQDLYRGLDDVSRWCRDRPRVVEEYGMPQRRGDAVRARFFGRVLARSRALRAAGTGFWNLGGQRRGNSFDVSPRTPLAWRAVRRAP